MSLNFKCLVVDFIYTHTHTHTHHVNNHGVSRRWFTETDVKHFKSSALRTTTNITRSMVNWKKDFFYNCIWKILFIDTENLFKMQISMQVLFMAFVNRFGFTYLKNRFLWSCLSKFLLINCRIATNLKTALSKKYSWKILFVYFKTTTKLIHLNVH